MKKDNAWHEYGIAHPKGRFRGEANQWDENKSKIKEKGFQKLKNFKMKAIEEQETGRNMRRPKEAINH